MMIKMSCIIFSTAFHDGWKVPESPNAKMPWSGVVRKSDPTHEYL